MKIAVLMTCHNRREQSLTCLHSLLSQRGLDGRASDWSLVVDIFLNDDGCTDGTRETVELLGGGSGWKIFVSSGSGRDYWARGMERAWQTAVAREQVEGWMYDGFLWLNDDVGLREDALEAALAAVGDGTASLPVVVGELVDEAGKIVYGKRGDLFTGNFVWVPRAVYEKVGMIFGAYHHAWADSDYALRCKRSGVEVVSCGVVGQCEGHPNRPSLEGLGLGARWGLLWEPKGWCLHDLWLYRRRNWGLWAAVGSCAHLIAVVVLWPVWAVWTRTARPSTLAGREGTPEGREIEL